MVKMNKEQEHPFWIAAGAALGGTILGAFAVYLAGTQAQYWRASMLNQPSAETLATSENTDFSKNSDGAGEPESLVAAIQRTRNTVVSIVIDGQVEGAGVVFRKEGWILTNYHVVESVVLAGKDHRSHARQVATEPSAEVRFINGRSLPAIVWVSDAGQDLAVLKMLPSKKAEIFQPAELGNSSQLKVGESVYAVGCPLGLEHTVSTGIVSALDRTDQLANIGLPAIQLDAAVNVGNSGGPLFNLRGEVVGITATRARKADGIGFAIPIDHVRAFFENWEKRGRVGETVEVGVDVDVRREVKEQIGGLGYEVGIWVERVWPGPAERAGMHVGDIIVEVRGKRFDGLGEGSRGRADLAFYLRNLTRSLVPGELLPLAVVRDGNRIPLMIDVQPMDPCRLANEMSMKILGLELGLREDCEDSTITNIVPGSSLHNQLNRSFRNRRVEKSVREQLRGFVIAKIGEQSITSVKELNQALASLNTIISAGGRPFVRISLRDPKNPEALLRHYSIFPPHLHNRR